LQSFEPGLKLVLAKFGDHVSLGDFLPFFDGQFDQQTGNLKSQLDLSRSFGPAGE
jgi:hypothetical protein